MLFFIFIILSVNPHEFDSKYDNAIATTKIASYKQSGLESEVNKVKDGTGRKVSKWIRDNNLQTTAAIIAYTVPVIVNKEATATLGNFNIKANKDKKQLVWGISF